MRFARFLSLTLAPVLLAIATPQPASAAIGSWFGLGKDEASADAKTTEASKTPQVMGKMTGGTKRLVSNTTGLFKPKTVTTRKSGLTGVKKAKKYEEPKPGFFQSLFHPEPPPPPKTIKEWMSLKQIHP